MKIFGLPPIGVVVATLVFYALGVLIYGIVFMETWMAAAGISASDAEQPGAVTYLLGLLITLMQVVGIGLVLKWSGWPSMNEALAKIGLLALLFAVPFAAYTYLYMPPHSSTLLLIDSAHLVIGWILSAAILTWLRPKYVAPVKRQSIEDPEAIYHD